MENNLEYIDAYFNKMLSREEAILFEKKIEEDMDFANEVAFYLSAKQSVQAQVNLEKKERFRELLSKASLSDVRPLETRSHGLTDWLRGLADRTRTLMGFGPVQPAPIPIYPNVSGSSLSLRRLMAYRIAVAGSLLIFLFLVGYLIFLKPGSPSQMADKYINENFQTLGVNMGSELDSIQDGLRLYNAARYDSAINQFESIIQRDTTNFTAKKWLGIVYLRVGNYEKALLYFQQLESYTLQANPAVFYQALTLMKRNQSGDKQKAKQLLHEVRDNDLDEKETARRWLRKL
jgi:tetratricopeptide (TPR) repeat protein